MNATTAARGAGPENVQGGNRWIFHCDCNSYFASVELLEHPELRAVPVAVCGDPEGRHGIVLAKNEAAKRFGIQTAETIWQARAKCPQLTLLRPHREKYRYYCNIINEIYQKYTDLVEPFSIDESWLDVTGSWHLFAADPVSLANAIRVQVRQTTGLTVSVGVSWNKVFAKLGSDYKKPDATTVFTADNYQQHIWPLPVGELIYVGKSAAATLHMLGVDTIGQLAVADEKMLADSLGKLGPQLRHYARGEDAARVRRVGETEPVKSVGNGMTFKKDLTTCDEVRAGIAALADEVAGRLRRHGLWAGGVQVTIKGRDLRSIQRQMRLERSTHLEKELTRAACALVEQNWPVATPIRMLTVTAVNLSNEPLAVQQSFLEPPPPPDRRRERLEASLDEIRQKYGRGAIAAASTVNPAIGLDGLEGGFGHGEADGENESSEGRQIVKGPR